jgi:cytochrome c553
VRFARRARWAWLAALFICSAAAQDRLPLCVACHGEGGNSSVPGTPSLAGQPALFIENQLVLIREGVRRVSAPMEAAVKGLTDREIRSLGAYYAARTPKVTDGVTDAVLAEQGAKLAASLRCGVCHLPDFRGREQIPRLAGQREDYLFEVMRADRDNGRTGVDTVMAAALYGVSDAQIRALAHFLSRQR